MNELVRDLDPMYRYVPIKFDHDQRRITLRRAVTGLAIQNNKRFSQMRAPLAAHREPAYSVLYIFNIKRNIF